VRCPPVALTDFSTLLVTCACYGDESNADRHAHGGDWCSRGDDLLVYERQPAA